jgi:hypothetical protein
MCIKSPFFKLNKFSKTLYNLPNLSMGGLSWCPIGYNNTQVKECFPRRPSLSHAKEYQMDRGMHFGNGVY